MLILYTLFIFLHDKCVTETDIRNIIYRIVQENDNKYKPLYKK